MRGQFGLAPWQEKRTMEVGRSGRQLDTKTSRVWPGGRIPYEIAETIDYEASREIYTF